MILRLCPRSCMVNGNICVICHFLDRSSSCARLISANLLRLNMIVAYLFGLDLITFWLAAKRFSASHTMFSMFIGQLINPFGTVFALSDGQRFLITAIQNPYGFKVRRSKGRSPTFVFDALLLFALPLLFTFAKFAAETTFNRCPYIVYSFSFSFCRRR